MLIDYTNKSAGLYRKGKVNGVYDYYLVTNIDIHIQPVSGNFNQGGSGSFGQDFKYWTSYNDIQDGDKIIVDTKEYKVISGFYLDLGSQPHSEGLLTNF